MRRLLFIGLAAAICLLAATPAVARAATPCYKRVWSDWSADGLINGQYSAKCLRTAIKKAPEDLRDYSSIIDDINAALLDGYAVKNGTNNGGSGPGQGSGPGGGTNTGTLTPQEAKRRAEQAVPHAGTVGSIPESSRSLPLPLLILAAVALAALLAASSPPLIKRYRSRFPRARPAPHPDRP